MESTIKNIKCRFVVVDLSSTNFTVVDIRAMKNPLLTNINEQSVVD